MEFIILSTLGPQITFMRHFYVLLVLTFILQGCITTYHIYDSPHDIYLYHDEKGTIFKHKINAGDVILTKQTGKSKSKSKFTPVKYSGTLGWVARDSIRYYSSTSKQIYTSYGSNETARNRNSSSTKPQSGSGEVHVRGYYRKDGTYVRPHSRSRPKKD